MRKYAPLVGYLRHNPRHYRFSIPNAVWEYKLKPIEFVILSYLCYCHCHGDNSNAVSAEAIAHAVHLTAGTVKKYLSTLVSRELITGEWSLAPAFQNTDDKKFFTLPNEIFLLNLPPSAFMVYAYLLLIEHRRTHTCHPSYNTIAAATGMTKNTAIKSIGILLDAGLITMAESRYIDQRGMKWKGNNLYTILPTRLAVDTFHRRQLHRLELDTERRRVRKRQEAYDYWPPRVASCPPASTATAPGPTPAT